MNRVYQLNISNTDLLAIEANVHVPLSEYFNELYDSIVDSIGEFEQYLSKIIFTTTYDCELLVNETHNCNNFVEVNVNPLMFRTLDSTNKNKLLETFLSSLNEADDIFNIALSELEFCETIIEEKDKVSLRLAPNFCDGSPQTLRQLKPHKVQSLISLLSNTFLPISNAEISCCRSAENYCAPTARVIDSTGIISKPMSLLASNLVCDGRLNGSFLGILSEGISDLLVNSNVPLIVKDMIKQCHLSISIDDEVPEFYTNGSENVLQDYLPQKIDYESGGGDSGAFLDAPGNCTPVCHFLLAEQSTEYEYNIMSIEEVWIKICLKSYPPSACMKLNPLFDGSTFTFPETPELILQISAVESNRKDYFEYMEDISLQPKETDSIINIGKEREDCYYVRNSIDHNIYRIPNELLHSNEISVVYGDERENFEDFLYGSFIMSLLVSIEQYYSTVFKYVISTDLHYSSSKLKLLIRDPNYNRIVMQKLYFDILTSEDCKYKEEDIAFDVLLVLVSEHKIIESSEKYDTKYQICNSYGRNFVRKQNLSNYALLELFEEFINEFDEQHMEKPCDNLGFIELVNKKLISRNECKFEIDDIVKFNYEILFENAENENQFEFLNYYNIIVEEEEEFLVPEIEQEIVLSERFAKKNDSRVDFIKFMDVSLHEKQLITLFPEMITLNGIGLLNEEQQKSNTVLELDLGYVSPYNRGLLYLYYQQTYPIIIKEISKQLTEYLTIDYILPEHEMAFIPDSEIMSLTKNQEYRNSSYYILSSIWQSFNIQRIIISQYIENNDLVDLFKEKDDSLTIILRIIKIDEQDTIFNYLNGSSSLLDNLITNVFSVSLCKEFDLIFSNKFKNLEEEQQLEICNAADIFKQMVCKLRLDKIMSLLNVGRYFEKYLLPIISSETTVIIPRHYPFLRSGLEQAFAYFILQFEECNFAGLRVNDSIKRHLHRILNTCAFKYYGITQGGSQIYVSALTEFEMKYKRGKMSIFVDTRNCDQIVKRHEDCKEVQTIEQSRKRIQYYNPINLYYLKTKIVLFCLLEKRDSTYYFVVDNQFRLAILAVPQNVYQSEHSREIFSRDQYSQSASCIISDGDILLENNQLVIEFNEEAVEKYASSKNEGFCQKSHLKLIEQIFNQHQFVNLKLEAFRFFLNDIDALFGYKIRSYAHLQSFWQSSFGIMCKDIDFFYDSLKYMKNLPLMLSTVINLKYHTSYKEKYAAFPLNFLLVNGQYEISKCFTAAEPLLAMIEYEHASYNGQISLNEYLELRIPATIISQNKFIMLDDIDAERVMQCEYEQSYCQIIDKLQGSDYSDNEGSFCIAEPSFCGFLLTVSINEADWQGCYDLYKEHNIAVHEDLECQVAIWLDEIVNKFSISVVKNEMVSNE